MNVLLLLVHLKSMVVHSKLSRVVSLSSFCSNNWYFNNLINECGHTVYVKCSRSGFSLSITCHRTDMKDLNKKHNENIKLYQYWSIAYMKLNRPTPKWVWPSSNQHQIHSDCTRWRGVSTLGEITLWKRKAAIFYLG